MTKNEEQLLKLIRENDNPSEAVNIAIDTIISFLLQHESSQSTSLAVLQELG